MAQETTIENPSIGKDDVADSNSADSEKLRAKKDRNRPPTKVVVRLLPPSMTKEIFLEQVSPLPEYDYLYFVKADLDLGQAAYSRAYINFLSFDDIFTFRDQFDGYIFVDKSGTEYPASVELAPFQRVPKKATVRRKDSKVGTIEEDPMYISFLESLAEELKEQENEHTFDYSYKPPDNDAKKVTTTPLLEFLKQRRADRQRNRDERKEDRRKKESKELERRKAREEEKKKRKPDFKEKESSTGTIPKVAARTLDKDGVTIAAKDSEGKLGDKKYEDKPSFKDRKFQEGRNRDKPAAKQAASRQKPFEPRTLRDDRRSSEDLHKKPARAADEKAEQKPLKTNTDVKKKYPEKDTGYAKPNNRKEDRFPDRKPDDKSYKDTRKDSVERRGDDKSFRDQQRKEKDDRYGDKKVEESRPLKDRKYSDNRPRDRKNLEKKSGSDLKTTGSDTKSTGSQREDLPVADESKEKPGGKDKGRKKSPVEGMDGDKEPRRNSVEGASAATKKADQVKTFQKSAESLSRVAEAGATKTRRSSLDSSKPEPMSNSGSGKEVRRIHSLELDGPPTASSEEKAAQRAERRIRNKDRPSIEIYRPGMGRISKQRAGTPKE